MAGLKLLADSEPRNPLSGVALLACTMAGAAVILAFVVGEPGSSIFPAVFFIVLVAIGLVHRSR